jgi:hypothetical protein
MSYTAKINDPKRTREVFETNYPDANFDDYAGFTEAGDLVSVVHPGLAQRLNVSVENVREIARLHVTRYEICTAAEALNPTSAEDNINIRILHANFVDNEFKLQELWGFDRNANFHRFWEFPHCTCPNMDNNDRLGSSYHVIDMSCPVHGTL